MLYDQRGKQHVIILPQRQMKNYNSSNVQVSCFSFTFFLLKTFSLPITWKSTLLLNT